MKILFGLMVITMCLVPIKIGLTANEVYNDVDLNKNYKIDINELEYLFTLYRSSVGYTCDLNNQVGLYKLGARLTNSSCQTMNTDSNTNYKIDLAELLRIFQFYNSEGYHVKNGTEDGFAPGYRPEISAPLSPLTSPEDEPTTQDQVDPQSPAEPVDSDPINPESITQPNSAIFSVSIDQHESEWINGETTKTVFWSYSDVPTDQNLKFRVGLYTNANGGRWGNNWYVPVKGSLGTERYIVGPAFKRPWHNDDYYIRVRLVNADNSDYRVDGKRVGARSDQSFRVVGGLISSVNSKNQLASIWDSFGSLFSDFKNVFSKNN